MTEHAPNDGHRHYWEPTSETPMGTEYRCYLCAQVCRQLTEVHSFAGEDDELLVQAAPEGWVVLRVRRLDQRERVARAARETG